MRATGEDGGSLFDVTMSPLPERHIVASSSAPVPFPPPHATASDTLAVTGGPSEATLQAMQRWWARSGSYDAPAPVAEAAPAASVRFSLNASVESIGEGEDAEDSADLPHPASLLPPRAQCVAIPIPGRAGKVEVAVTGRLSMWTRKRRTIQLPSHSHPPLQPSRTSSCRSLHPQNHRRLWQTSQRSASAHCLQRQVTRHRLPPMQRLHPS